MMATWLDAISAFVWGPFLLVPLLLLTGLFLTLRLRGLQFTKLWGALWLALVVRREKDGEGDVSHFQALMTALAATVGTGNIVGVAGAIAIGGPGALFWMWMTGLVGMATKYTEALLSVHYRVTETRGEQAGGPMYYLSQGLAQRRLGRLLGGSFALFAVLASFGIGNLTQSNSMAESLQTAFGVTPWVSGLFIALCAGAVVLGGIRSIGRFTGVFVPVMVFVYMAGAALVLAFNAAEIPAAIALVFRDAFTGTAATGGFAGATIALAVQKGVARGIFSNESGLGSAGIAAAAAQTREPVRQALVSMTQTFIDTLVVCTMTGLAILVTGVWDSGERGATLTQSAFVAGLPGGIGDELVALSLTLFAFSTILGWCFYLVFVFVVFVGAVSELRVVWSFSEVMNGLMALPNLVGLLLLSGVAARLTKDYFDRS